ncbi:unnamed protein product [Linum tenue]|uniref:Uncharacterized protein n=1 Tax=Linum tenue TaxID=586396 RepID=A0AAV0PT29_9ROSI|nr:unnamed protein product [Linum tenue]
MESVATLLRRRHLPGVRRQTLPLLPPTRRYRPEQWSGLQSEVYLATMESIAKLRRRRLPRKWSGLQSEVCLATMESIAKLPRRRLPRKV